MGFGKWLKGATRVRFDSHTLGNLARNGGLAAGALIGGPAGAALAGGISAARTAARPGANFGDILKSGIGDASTAYGLNKVGGFAKGALSSAGAGAGEAVQAGAAGGAPVPIPPVPSAGGLAPITQGVGGVPAPITAANVATGGGRAVVPGAFRSALNATGSFVRNNPTAAGMTLQGVGGLATAGTENRVNEAQARLLEQRAGETEYDFEQRKRRDAELAPLWSQLGSTFAANNSAVARNPYAPGA
jgi:hypothetical protein